MIPPGNELVGGFTAPADDRQVAFWAEPFFGLAADQPHRMLRPLVEPLSSSHHEHAD